MDKLGLSPYLGRGGGVRGVGVFEGNLGLMEKPAALPEKLGNASKLRKANGKSKEGCGSVGGQTGRWEAGG